MSVKCSGCEQPVLQMRLEGRPLQLSLEPVTGVRLDQKHPEDVTFLTGRVVQVYVPHTCLPPEVENGNEVWDRADAEDERHARMSGPEAV